MRALPTTVVTPALLLSLALAAGLGACTAQRQAAPSGAGSPSSPASPTGSASTGGTTPQVPVVPGLRPGEVPPVPLITVPDVTALTASQRATSDRLAESLSAIAGATPGLEVTAARCDGTGAVVNGAGTLVPHGEGAGVVSDGRGTVVVEGDGAGVSTTDGVTIVNNGDGTGSYSDGTTSISLDGGGAGSYVDGRRTVTLSGDGAGTSVDGSRTTTVNTDGSGTWTDGTRTTTNDGDGSGTYTDGTLTIVNDGTGQALVDGVPVAADPLPPVGRAGSFPPVQALAPLGNVCGTLVRLPGDVLFDFDSARVRADAAPVLQVLADALQASPPAQPVRVDGHTDGFGTDAYNQDLSVRRATAVASWLGGHGVTASLAPQGFGETRPIAPETVDGHDDPAGRQLNRRVEFVLPGPSAP